MRRLEGFAAIGFAVAYVVALVLTNVSDEGESRREAMDFYNSAVDKWRELIAVYVMATAVSTLGDAFLLVVSMFAAAAFVGTLAWSRVVPRWLALSGWVVAIACLFGFTFVPLLLFAVWMLVLGAASLPRPVASA